MPPTGPRPLLPVTWSQSPPCRRRCPGFRSFPRTGPRGLPGVLVLTPCHVDPFLEKATVHTASSPAPGGHPFPNTHSRGPSPFRGSEEVSPSCSRGCASSRGPAVSSARDCPSVLPRTPGYPTRVPFWGDSCPTTNRGYPRSTPNNAKGPIWPRSFPRGRQRLSVGPGHASASQLPTHPSSIT